MASLTVQQFKLAVVLLVLSTIAISWGSDKEVLTSIIPSTTTTVAVELPSQKSDHSVLTEQRDEPSVQRVIAFFNQKLK